MDIKKILFGIKNRYFRPVIARPEGIVTHHGDCSIYRPSGEAFCSCGLLHDLNCLKGGIADKIWPNYGSDYKLQECPDAKKPTPEEIKAMDEELQNILGPFAPMTEEERKIEDEEDWQLIVEVFGEDYVDYLRKG